MWLEQFQQQCASINQCHTRLMSLRMRSEASLKAELDKILTLTTTSRATTTPSSTTTTDTSNNELERLLLPSSNDNGSDVPEDVVTDEVLAGCYPHVPEAYRRVLYLLQKGMHSMFIYVRVPHSTILVTILIYIICTYSADRSGLWPPSSVMRQKVRIIAPLSLLYPALMLPYVYTTTGYQPRHSDRARRPGRELQRGSVPTSLTPTQRQRALSGYVCMCACLL